MKADGTDVYTTCRSNTKSLLVTGGDFVQVNLFKFPVVTKKQNHKVYSGHSSIVTRARFAF